MDPPYDLRSVASLFQAIEAIVQHEYVLMRHADNRVRGIRNGVMYFDPDGIPDDDRQVLPDFARFVQQLQSIGAT